MAADALWVQCGYAVEIQLLRCLLVRPQLRGLPVERARSVATLGTHHHRLLHPHVRACRLGRALCLTLIPILLHRHLRRHPHTPLPHPSPARTHLPIHDHHHHPQHHRRRVPPRSTQTRRIHAPQFPPLKPRRLELRRFTRTAHHQERNPTAYIYASTPTLCKVPCPPLFSTTRAIQVPVAPGRVPP